MDKKTSDIVLRYKGQVGGLLCILNEVQETFGYLPKEVLKEIASELAVPLSQLFSSATFYSAFTLKQRGKHAFHICVGTSCHIKKAPDILDEFSRLLKVAPGNTTENDEFSLETVQCIGCCSLAPAIGVDRGVHGHATVDQVPDIIKKYKGTT